MTRPEAPDAVIIGAGHNGLVAANVLADAGWSVVVHEAEHEVGGAVRSGELVEPGFVTDRCSAFYPLAAASPVLRALELERYGVRFRHGPLVVAHPAPDGSCAILSRDVEETAAALEPDGMRWRRLMRTWARVEPALLRGMRTPFPQVRAALQLALEPNVVRLARPGFRGWAARRLVLGNALHTDAPPGTLLATFFGVALCAFGQRYGYPCAEGGAGTIAAALAARARGCGVEIRLGERVSSLADVPARRAVIAAIDTWELGRLLGRPSRVRPDPATLKLDWTLDGPIPWTAADARRAPVVHIGDETSFVLFGQYSMADATRAPAGKETAWAYSHVLGEPDAVEAAVEAVAPGFRSLVRRRRVERLPPGAVNGGTARLGNQLVLRGRFGRAGSGVPGVYLASASAHPGGGVHGAPGWIAARAALRRHGNARASSRP